MASSSTNAFLSSIVKQCARTHPSKMGREELMAVLRELISYNETSLTSREAYAATMVANVTRTVAAGGGCNSAFPPSSSSPSFSEAVSKKASSLFGSNNNNSNNSSGSGPLLKVEETHRLPLSLWCAVLPWEVQRGYSCTPEAVVCGKNGMPLTKEGERQQQQQQEGPEEAEEGEEDPLGVVTGYESGTAADSAFSSSTLTDAEADALARKKALAATAEQRRALAHSNGVLFVHRDTDVPHYWSGGIQASLDVSFLALPTDPEALANASLAAEHGVKSARNGIAHAPYQLLGRPAGKVPFYGSADDPGPYNYYLRNRKEMRLTVSAAAHLDPFPAVLRAMSPSLGGMGETFCGDHRAYLENSPMDRSYQCSPSASSARGGGGLPLTTAILETRRRLLRDFIAALALGPQDLVGLDLCLSAAMMEAMEAKEMFYRDLIAGLEMKVHDELELCHRPAPETRGEEEEGGSDGNNNNTTNINSNQNALNRPLEAWRSEDSKKDSLADRLSEVPNAPPASRLGTDGSFSLSKLRAARRICPTQPGMLVTPPVDVELFAAATRLGLAHSAQHRILPRLVNDLTRSHVANEDVAVLHGLATDPSVQVYPDELLVAIHAAHARARAAEGGSRAQ